MDLKDIHWNIKTFDELTAKELYEILRARAEVFIKGQGIKCVDPDGVDYDSLHVYSMTDDGVNSYLRAYRSGDGIMKMGRILAMPQRKGIGTGLMEYAIKRISEVTGCTKIIMDAQKHAVPFYERLGFKVTSDEYLEEGIVHVDMCLDVLQMKESK